MAVLSPRPLRRALRARHGAVVRIFGRTTSTQEVLRALLGEGAGIGSVVAADEQTSGRGRSGRIWTAAPRSGLLVSVLGEARAGLLSAVPFAVGVALATVLEELVPHGLALKWPNDVLVDGYKLAGVLCESVPRQSRMAVIAGIGINIQGAAPPGLPAVDLCRVTSSPIDRSALLAEIVAAVLFQLDRLESQGRAAILDSWRAFDAFPEGLITVDHATEGRLVGRYCGIDGSGALLLSCDDGIHAMVAGDVHVGTFRHTLSSCRG